MRSFPGPLADAAARALAALRRAEAVRRLWDGDHTLWRPAPREIRDRLGWLTAPERTAAAVPELVRFAAEVAAAGRHHTLLLGMGGSSLGAAALGEAYGCEGLTVLDSTVPSWVARVSRGLDPRRTLVLAASKSGTTVEVEALLAHFEGRVGPAACAALTDPETPLAARARTAGFRRLFTNPPDVGGRYSVLTLFGLLPAALAGVDPEPLLASARALAARIRPEVALEENPAARLAALLGAAARCGRWKLTIYASPALAGFALWLEQLLAESTGKEGKGILPVVGEGPAPPERYGPDRLFLALRLAAEDPPEAVHLEALAAAGHPVVRREVPDLPALGGEFFLWEAATALAGHLLGIHPFDQPDVEAAKKAAREVLARLRAGGSPPLEGTVTPGALLRSPPREGYLALQGYTDATPALEAAVARLRAVLLRRHGLTTTWGYGPRYLHSTGQFHKGGPPVGLFLQVLETGRGDLPVPGAGYTFGALAAAQAAGDRETLRRRGRPVAVVATADPAAALNALAAELEG